MSFNIAVIGAGGRLGTPVLEVLLSSKSPRFNVTVINRTGSKFSHSNNDLKILNVDFSDQGTLIKALSGHDYMLPLLGNAAGVDNKLIDAAIAAGVPRIFGNEYTLDCLHPSARAIAKPETLGARIAQADRLIQEGKEGRLEWTILMPGGFLDFGFMTGFLGIDIKNRRAELYDESSKVTGCTMEFVAHAIAYAAGNWDQVRNRRVQIAETAYTSPQAIDLFEQKTGEKFTTTKITSAELVAIGEKAYAAGDLGTALRNCLIGLNYSGEEVAYFPAGLDFAKDSLVRKSLENIVNDAVDGLN